MWGHIDESGHRVLAEPGTDLKGFDPIRSSDLGIDEACQCHRCATKILNVCDRCRQGHETTSCSGDFGRRLGIAWCAF